MTIQGSYNNLIKFLQKLFSKEDDAQNYNESNKLSITTLNLIKETREVAPCSRSNTYNCSENGNKEED